MWGHWKDVESEYESKVNDPWDWVTHFENAIARYTGATHAIACDSNSNAIRLCLEWLKQTNQFSNSKIKIPANTYCSVPNAIILSGNTPILEEREWYRHYKLGSTPIYDCAVCLYEGMYDYINKDNSIESPLLILSFHHRKIINIGQGGMILTNDDKFNEWARPMIYDGRRKYFTYDSDVLQCVGWHMYMTPEQAKKGLEIFHSEKINSTNKEKTGSWKDYTNLQNQPIYQDLEHEFTPLNLNANGDYVINKIRIEGTDYTVLDFLFNLKTREVLSKKFKPENWQSTFDNVDFLSLPESMNFVVYDDVEFFGIWEENPIIKWLIEYFDAKGLINRLIFYGNHLDVKPKDPRFNYVPMPFFIGDTCHLSRVIEPKHIKFEKTFIHLTSQPKMHRINTHIFLHDSNILEKCHWSWNPNKIEMPLFSGILKKYPFLKESKSLSDVGDSGLSVSMMHTIPQEWHESFCAIVTESRYYTDKDEGIINDKDEGCFITEKTEKCFTVGIPFIMVSTPGFLKKLKELGFKTFDKWWDESYDDEKNPAKRFKKIKDLIYEISKWDNEKIEKTYAEMKDVLRWNQVLNIAINLENKKIKRTRKNYINMLRFKPLPYQNSFKISSPLIASFTEPLSADNTNLI